MDANIKYKYDMSQCFNIHNVLDECNERARNGFKLHTLLCKGKGEKLIYTMMFEKQIKE